MSDCKSVSEQELLIALKSILKKNGYLNKVSAEVCIPRSVTTQTKMRAKVTELLHDRQTLSGEKKSEPPRPTDEVLLINELVREYLEWNGYLYTASVMSSETGMPKDKKKRSELCAEVGVKDDDKSAGLPLLSNIVAAYTERIKRKINKSKKDAH